MQQVFIIGSKGIPGAYGGYETFVDKLTEYHQDHPELRYHVACKDTENGEFEYHNARCFRIRALELGAAQAIVYDIASLRACIAYIRQNHVDHPIVYILAYRIGPFMRHFQKKIHRLGGVLYTNPDGHEYLRRKWSWIVRRYWRFSERLTVKHSDLLICDSKISRPTSKRSMLLIIPGRPTSLMVRRSRRRPSRTTTPSTGNG